MRPQPHLQAIGDEARPRRGVTPPSGSGGERLLGDVVIELGYADREAVERALEAARTPGKRLGEHLIEDGRLTEDQLARALAERYGIDHVDLTEFEVDPQATSLVPRSLAARHQAVPIAFEGEEEEQAVVVAMADPGDWLATDEIAESAGLDIRPAVASSDDIAALLERTSEAPREADRAARKGKAPRRDQAAGTAPLGGAAASPSPAPPPARPGGTVLDGELDVLRQELGSAYARIEAADEELAATRRELTAAQRHVAEARLELAGVRKGPTAG
jgi:hypothetical protein